MQKFHQFIKRHRRFTLASIVAPLLVAGIAYGVLSKIGQTNDNQVSKRSTAQVGTDLTEQQTQTEQPAEDNSANDMTASETQLTRKGPIPVTQNPASSPSAPPEQASVLTVNRIFVYNPIRYCGSGVARLGLGTATVYLTGSQGGMLNWQAEGRRDGTTFVVASNSVTIPAGQYVYDVPVSTFYVQIIGDTAIRIHVTAPNDMASDWYPAPAPDGYC